MNIHGELKWFLGDDKEYAKLGFTESHKAFSIDIVLVPKAHRGKGIGSALIAHILAMADTLQKDIYLSARPIAGTTTPEKQHQLVKYYKNFGFKIIDEGVTATYMVRKQIENNGDHTHNHINILNQE